MADRGQQFLFSPEERAAIPMRPDNRQAPVSKARWERPAWALGTDGRTYIPGDPRAHEVNDRSHKEAVYQAAAVRGRPSIRFPDRAVGGLQKHGRFLSQHDTGDTSGEYDPEMRRDVEKQLFGTSKTEKRRPIYGYVDHPGDSIADGNVETYGELKAVLKPSVRQRTTMTWGDSLDASTKPVALTDAAAGRFEEGHTYLGGRRPGYIEAQYHGGLPTKDIEHLEINTSDEADNRRVDHEAVAAALKVPWRRLEPETAVHQQLPVLRGPQASPTSGNQDWTIRYRAGHRNPGRTGDRTPEQQQDLESGRLWGPHGAFAVTGRQFREVDRSPDYRSAYPHPDWE